MTELRQRMIQDLQLRGFSERTQEMYVRAVRQLAEHFHKSPDQISEEQLRQYFLFIKNVKHYSRSASTIALCGIKFFYEHTLHRHWPTLSFVRAPREKKLPVLLSPQEVQRVLHAVRLPRYRVCLTTIYSCGLRLKACPELVEGKAPICRSRISIAPVWLFMSTEAKGPRIVMSLSQNVLSNYSDNTGKPTEILSGSFQLQDGEE